MYLLAFFCFVEPSDPTCYIVNDYMMDNALNYVKKLNEQQKEVHITLTHVFALGAAWGIYKMRRDIGRLPWGTFKAAKKLGVTVLVDVQGGKDLVPVTIWDAHKMTIFEVAKKISERVKRAKDGKDDRHNKSTQSANFVPSFIAQPCIYGLTYLAANVGLNLNFLGVKSDTFGHIVITNIGMMGYTSAFAPLCPPLHQISLLCLGKIEKRTWIDTKDEDKIKIANFMTSVATGDHRYGDAAIMAPFFSTMKGFIDDPDNFNEKDHRDVPHYKELKDK